MGRKVRINQLVEEETRNRLFLLRSKLKKKNIGEVVDEVVRGYLKKEADMS